VPLKIYTFVHFEVYIEFNKHIIWRKSIKQIIVSCKNFRSKTTKLKLSMWKNLHHFYQIMFILPQKILLYIR